MVKFFLLIQPLLFMTDPKSDPIEQAHFLETVKKKGSRRLMTNSVVVWRNLITLTGG